MREVKEGLILGAVMTVVITIVQLVSFGTVSWPCLLPIAILGGVPMAVFIFLLIVGLWVHR